MKLHTLLTGALVALSLVAGGASAQTEKEKKQAEVVKATQAGLQKFYKANPALKDAVAKAPGYAVFTSYGLSFLIGGAGGSGLEHDKKTGKNEFMDMAQASVGVQIGASETDTLIIFKNAAAMEKFIKDGWTYGGGASALAGAAGKTAGSGAGENVIADAVYYTYSKNGFQAGGAVAGTKFWKSDSLN
ncbi:MAG: YSC84-related protein [Betaproteobacteria bacterium]